VSIEALEHADAVYAAALAELHATGETADPHVLKAVGRARTWLAAVRALKARDTSEAASGLIDAVSSDIALTFGIAAPPIKGVAAREVIYARLGANLVSGS